MAGRVVSRRAFLGRASVAVGGMLAWHAAPVRAAGRAAALLAHPATGTTGHETARAIAGLAPPPIVTRAEWGADEARRHTRPRFLPLRSIVVHHTATDPTDDAAADVREVMRLHLLRDDGRWGDIGYHFLIHPNGAIHEGRWARDYAAGEPHDGHDADGNVLTGVHTRGANHGTLGVALIGDYRRHRPSIPALTSLVSLTAWLCDRHRLDPTLDHPGVGDDGVVRSATIIGHQDAAGTECPGETVHALLPDLRQWVVQRRVVGFRP